MRIWDLPPRLLCRQHLLGEHRELHGLWNILTQGKKGYANHPETKRWKGRERALWYRHIALVDEMEARGYRHDTPISGLHDWWAGQPEFNRRRLATLAEQREILRAKGCGCKV